VGQFGRVLVSLMLEDCVTFTFDKEASILVGFHGSSSPTDEIKSCMIPV